MSQNRSRRRRLSILLGLALVLGFAACTGRFGDPPVIADDDEEREPGDTPREPGDDQTDASPVEEPDAGAPDPDCTDQAINLLGNPGFDDGPSGWLENSALEIIVTAPELVHTPVSPAHAAWLGGFDPSVQAMAQRHTIPADATALVVRGHRLINTADTAVDNDILRFFILDADGNVLEMLSDPTVACSGCTYSNTSGTSAVFVPFTLTAAASHAGQEVLFHIQSDLPDDGTNTNFYLDSMALEATVCR